MIARLKLAWYWLRSRYASPNVFVSCSTCPNWIFHSRVKSPAVGVLRAGLCRLDEPHVFRDYHSGYALRIWTARDRCARHPHYDPSVVAGSNLEFRPHDKKTAAYGGFSRMPNFAEALKLARGASEEAISMPDPLRPQYRFTMGDEPGKTKE